MAAAAVPPGSSFYNTESQPSLFLNDSGSIGFGITNFGENSSCTTFSTWSSCSDESSFTPAATFFDLENSPAYPIGEGMLLDGDSWELQGCDQPVMQPALVHSLKNMVTPEPSSPEDEYNFDEGHLGGSLELEVLQRPDSSPLSPPSTSDGSLTSQVTVGEKSEYVVVQVKRHEPPPLNMKRLEKVEDLTEDDVEAAEVSVDVIQNRRPFQCGQAGCNKTFKNPQTMKMHHKTHYTDGSAIDKDGVATLPTLTPSLKAGQNKKIPSRCPKCRKTFVGLYELRRHYGRKHSEGEKPFGCRKCEKKFYIEVDVRDHEKLCGEPIECKCGLKFAFKCNLVAHKKAHPGCQDNQTLHQPTSNSYSFHNNQLTTSDDDSSHSPGNSRLTLIPRGSSKRRHGQGEETSSIKYPSSKQMKYYTLPAPDFKGIPQVDAMSTSKAASYDFAGLHFSIDGSSLWSSNMHYPSVDFANLPSMPMPSTMYTSAFGGLQQLGSQMYNSCQEHGPCHEGDFKFQSNPNTQLELIDRAPSSWNSASISGL